MTDRRQELLNKSLDYLLQHGVASLSLRPLAVAIGTSGRLLIYHFGSKDGLITAVVKEVRGRLQRSFSALSASSHRAQSSSPMGTFWSWTTRAETISHLRLLFEVQILALQNPERYARYMEETSTSWLKLIEDSLPPSRDRRTIATLCVAVIDGLLLEYMSTGDVRRTTRALSLFDRLIFEESRAQ
jgi:AcrR family transcriptional regulator